MQITVIKQGSNIVLTVMLTGDLYHDTIYDFILILGYLIKCLV